MIYSKIRTLGFTGVSLHTDWSLPERNPGHVVTDGIWSLDGFFAAAKEARIYLIARPGPYIQHTDFCRWYTLMGTPYQ